MALQKSLPFLLLLMLVSSVATMAAVSYDHRSMVINGQRRILISGSIHYPRSTPQMWPELIQKAKDGGLDVIQTYVFWNGHEPSPGQYYFEDRYDLVRFVKLVKQAGLYVHLRIGPYVCAEWNFGGFPVWLKFVPGISFRTDNGPFKDAMQKFVGKIVSMMKSEGLFEWQGGPIILSQIENEYDAIESRIGPAGKAYAYWAAKMAVGQETGVPWVMCKQADAPDPVINTCNGFYCDYFSPNAHNKPSIWTEAWTGWYTSFGEAVHHRPVEDLAFAVARFIQKGGSFINYYVYHGGTNFDRTAGGPFVATSYDFDAPIDEYGLLRQPKWGHLKDMHKAIKMCEPALLSGDPIISSVGYYEKAHVYKSSSGACAAFLSNYHTNYPATVIFNGIRYVLPPWSISILPDCKTEVFNTATVKAPLLPARMNWASKFSWHSYNENPYSSDERSFAKTGLLDQIALTWDKSDYLWYTTFVSIDKKEIFLKTGQWPQLSIYSFGHAMHVFVNGQFSGTVSGSARNPKLSYSEYVKLHEGSNKISILSVAVGLPNQGSHFESWGVGVLGPVTLSGLNEGKRDLSLQQWIYQVGLTGESLGLHSLSVVSSVQWEQAQAERPLTWYKTLFNAPLGDDPLALDMGSMTKGQVWVNGRSIGRYWTGYKAFGNCGSCEYSGTYRQNKCDTGCGEPTQRWYHLPRSWTNPSGNLLVVLEELGGDPDGITLVTRRAS